MKDFGCIKSVWPSSKSLVRILTGGFYFFFAFSFFLHWRWRWPNLNWTDLGQSKPMIGQTAVMELTKNCPFYSRFIKIFSWIFFLSIFTTLTDGISHEVFYAYWKVIGFAIPSTIAALLFFPAISLSYHRQFHFDQSQERISYVPY